MVGTKFKRRGSSEMPTLSKLRFVATVCGAVAFIAISAPSLANTLSQADYSRLGNLHGRFIKLSSDLSKIATSMVSSTGVSREVVCLMRVEDQATGVDLYLYPMVFVVQIASFLTDPGDEKMAVTLAATPLSQLSKSLDSARDEINRIFGSCRQYPLIYDQAKSLMNLIDETQKTVQPILKRVEAAKLF